MDIKELLTITITRKASDLHLVVSRVPVLRINGELHPLVTLPIMSRDDIESMIYSLLNPTQKELLFANKELDFSISLTFEDKQARFRVNSYYQMGSLASSFRLIPSKIKTIDELGLPSLFHEFAKIHQGFILITGPSGQGKSTSLSSIIEEINKTKNVHIITIEDPIEYVYSRGKAIVSQREMYQDTHSWNNALRNSLREDPDVVFIGEMRDYETISSALTIAETGHLVFSTLHTNSAAQSLDRIIDIFPAVSQDQVRLQLSMVISAIITQRLVPSISGSRVPVCEILLGSSSIRNVIREGKTHLIDNIIQTSKDLGMMTFEDHLKQRVEQNIISPETALEYAFRPERYTQLMKG
ncbi:type IV pili twitching motility protein PilT [Candidatus Gottesmanbacteria bacterium RIFCSPLOWO2_01_FULL_39_12b]|uniref:Type IV pili twitching motility protein PilT n=1 Tax=Candidatus Gottesmanbacteria bacterium RIFCSPLOWO2_01_FULL_39_12b TaxID=1798388 RepID=A0A1F6AQN5_9BACT|nr:MAG: type IV pili twitching motility protein PilT [Candidatus Gottesmanbacteria bacterium RIFCSPLOWO2_01_FULL_39_12b]